MTYEQMMAAYNGLDKKLMIKSVIQNNLFSLKEWEIPTFFADARFYNRHLTFEENKKIKMDLVTKLCYIGMVNFGKLDGEILYLGEQLNSIGLLTTFHPYGMVKMVESPDEAHHPNYRYKFHPKHYTMEICEGKKKIIERHGTYMDVASIMGKLYSKHRNEFQRAVIYMQVRSEVIMYLTNAKKKYIIYSIISKEGVETPLKFEYNDITREFRIWLA